MYTGKPTEKYDYMAKVVILGDSSVGKTNILLRYTSQQYKPTHLATVGVDFKIKTLEVAGCRIKMQLWDTAGQERFKTITETYYKGAAAIVLVYSVGDRKTFNNIASWMSQISQHNDQDIPKIIVGNKCDLPQAERIVSSEEGMILAEKYKVPFLETSAKEGININEIFQLLGQKMAEKFRSSKAEEKPSVINGIGGTQITSINVGSQKKKKKECCQ